MNLLSYDSVFSRTIRLIWKIGLLSILWLVCSLPIVTIGIATTALYYTVLQNVVREQSYFYRSFFHAVRENGKNALLSGLFFSALAGLFAFEYRYCRILLRSGEPIGQMYLLFALFFVFTLLLAFYTFAYQARFQTTVRVAIHDAFLMMLGHLGTTLWIAFYLGVSVLAVTAFPITILLMPMTCVWMSSRKLEKLFYRIMREEDRAREDVLWGRTAPAEEA